MAERHWHEGCAEETSSHIISLYFDFKVTFECVATEIIEFGVLVLSYINDQNSSELV